jgi:histidyl-tRNA synthetase
MKYLFFDIECSIVSKTAAKICAFGYCLTDEKFNILDKQDILINPQGGFHLTDRKGTQGLVLPYKYEEFKKYPTFCEKADEIYAKMSKKFSSTYDITGSIGKRYRRQDEIGTPFCVTVDFQTLEDNTVTVRDRDTMEQIRVSIDDAIKYVEEKIEF